MTVIPRALNAEFANSSAFEVDWQNKSRRINSSFFISATSFLRTCSSFVSSCMSNKCETRILFRSNGSISGNGSNGIGPALKSLANSRGIGPISARNQEAWQRFPLRE